MKKLITIFMSLSFLILINTNSVKAQEGKDPGNKPTQYSKATNYWTGAANNSWGNGSNWSLGHYPNAGEDAVITNAGAQPVRIFWTDKTCNNLTINTGGSIRIEDKILTVNGDLYVNGSVIMNNDAGQLYIMGNTIWESGSTVNVTASIATIKAYGHWNFNPGANVQFTNGNVDFYGNTTSYIRVKSNNCYFNRLRLSKSGNAIVGFSSLSQADLDVNAYLSVGSSTVFNSYTSHDIVFAGFTFAYTGSFDFSLGSGKFIFDGVNQQIYNSGGGTGVFNGLEFNASNGVTLNGDDLTAKGDLTINSGFFDPDGQTVYFSGENWTNNVGDAGFTEGTGKVVFNRNGHQYCSDEIFNTLEVDKASGAFRTNGTNVTCAAYDWTAGAVDVLSGSFTANDLLDNAITGAFYLNSGGTIDLNNPGGWVDLRGDLHIYGGTMNVTGTTSYWPFNGNASIEMSDGTLDFKTCGIRIYNTTAYTLTENITGGIIRTSSHFIGDRADFTPTAGTFEFYGTSDRPITQYNGCTLYDVNINKTAKSGSYGNESLIDPHSGKVISDGGKANRIYLNSDITITNQLTVSAGTLDLNGHELTVLHDCDVYGTLKMADAADIFNMGVGNYDNLTFHNGSTGNLSNGNVNLAAWIITESGSTFTATTGNTITAIGGATTSGIENTEANTVFGNIVLDKTSGTFYLSANSSEDHIISGDFTLNAGNHFKMQNNTLIAQGNLIDNTSSEIYVYNAKKGNIGETPKGLGSGIKSKGGNLEIFNDFTLNGLMDMGDGNVLAHHRFNIANTGTLTNSGGDFVCDYDINTNWSTWDGNYNLSAGLIEFSSSNAMMTGTSNFTGGTLRFGRSLLTSSNAFEQNGGTVELIGASNAHYISLGATSYIHDFNFNRTASLYTANDLTIHGDVFINSGEFQAVDHTITIGGNWTNNVGNAGFNAGTGNLIFNAFVSGTPQDVNGTNTFNNVEQINNSAYLRFNDETTVLNDLTLHYYCWAYDLMTINGILNIDEVGARYSVYTPGANTTAASLDQGGEIKVFEGVFTANDLVDNGIKGTYTLLSGEINLFQDAGSFTDLRGDITINDGLFTVNGGNGMSWWAYGEDASLTMTGGVLDFNNAGANVFNSTHTLTLNITGGTIKTAGHFEVQSPVYTPNAGLLEFYSTSNSNFKTTNGSNVYNVLINKSAKSGTYNYPLSKRDIAAGMNVSGIKANQVNLINDVNIDGDFTLDNGVFNTATYNMTVAGNWTNNMGDGGFLEGMNTVTFDGASDKTINTDETFYNLTLDKTASGWNALQLGTTLTVNVLHDLNINDGSLEMESNSTLDIDNDVSILLGAGLNVNDGGVSVFVGGDWTNNNVAWNSSGLGYRYGSETLTFDGTTDQILTTSAPREEFGNLVIDKSAGEFKPNATLDITENLLIIDGAWDDNVTGLTHYFEGDFQVNSTGGYHGSGITTVFKGSLDQDITFNSSTYLTDMVIDKSNWSKKSFSGGEPEKAKPNKNKDANSEVRLMTNLNITYGELNIDEGILNLNGHSFRSSGGINVNSDGTLSLDAGSMLRVGQGTTLSINAGGTFEAIGTAANNATVTKFNNSAGFYSFSVENGGTISSEYTTYEYINIGSLDVKAGAFVDPAKAFNYCTFKNSQPGMGGMLGLFNDQALTCTGVTFENNGTEFNVGVQSTPVNDVTMIDAQGDYAGPEYEYDDNGHLHWTDIDIELDLNVILEGAYNGVDMDTDLKDAGVLPLSQPFNQFPWNYAGTESVAAIPANVVDWVLVQLRDSDLPANADETNIFEEHAAFLLKDGSIVDMDGVSPLQYTTTYEHKVFPVILQYNHLAVISATNVTRDASGKYAYDFTNGAYGGAAGEKEVSPGVWAMFGGDSYEDGIINADDIEDWRFQAGKTGYHWPDMDMNGYVDNKDKNDICVPNLGATSQVNGPTKSISNENKRIIKK